MACKFGIESPCSECGMCKDNHIPEVKKKVQGDLISRSALLNEMDGRYKEKRKIVPDNLAEGFAQTEKLIKEQPAVEAKPVVRGRRETGHGTLFPVYRCSECNCASALGQTNFCPNCGADMRKKVE